MNEKDCLQKIRDTISKTLKTNRVGKFKIYLFGSRARDQEREDSDYDIVVVTNRTFDGKEKFNLLRKIRKEIKYLGLSIDIILKSTEEYRSSKDYFGSFIYSIKNEMVAI